MIQKPEGVFLAHQAVVDTMLRFATALDTHNWKFYRSCFADTVEVDYGDATGLPATMVDADAWTAFVRACVGPLQTHHVFTNFSVELGDETAFVRHYHVSRHRRPNQQGGDQYTQYGWYEARLVALGDGWRISSLRHCTQWCDGNPLVVDTTTDEYKQAADRVFGTQRAV